MDMPLIISGFVFSALGFIYFSYGRKLKKLEITLCGIGLMIYPYFVTSINVSIAIGVVVSLIPFLMRWW